jgi:hypothetical protein
LNEPSGPRGELRDGQPLLGQIGRPLAGFGREVFEAETGFAFKAPRQLTAVESSEARLQPDQRVLYFRSRFLDRDPFSPAMSPNDSKHGC